MAFSVRLLLAILAVVVITTGSTLLIAQRQNRVTYRAVVDELFELQSAAFLHEQEFRHAAAAAQAARLATSVRLFAALEERDPDLYKIAADELRSGDYAFFRLLDRDGVVLQPPEDSRAGMPELADASLAPLSTAAAKGAERSDVQLGFMTLADSADTLQPYRVLTMSINSFGSHVGSLVIAQLVSTTFSPANKAGSNPVRSALVINNQLISDEIDPATARALQVKLDLPDRDSARVVPVGESTALYRKYVLNDGSVFRPAFLLSSISMASFDADQRELAWRIALTGVVASLLAGGLALFLSRLLAEPVARLVTATRAIRAGDFAQLPNT